MLSAFRKPLGGNYIFEGLLSLAGEVEDLQGVDWVDVGLTQSIHGQPPDTSRFAASVVVTANDSARRINGYQVYMLQNQIATSGQNAFVGRNCTRGVRVGKARADSDSGAARTVILIGPQTRDSLPQASNMTSRDWVSWPKPLKCQRLAERRQHRQTRPPYEQESPCISNAAFPAMHRAAWTGLKARKRRERPHARPTPHKEGSFLDYFRLVKREQCVCVCSWEVLDPDVPDDARGPSNSSRLLIEDYQMSRSHICHGHPVPSFPLG